MKKLCTMTLDGQEFEYMLDIGRRQKGYLSVKDSVVTVKLPLNGKQSDAVLMIESHKQWLYDKLKQSSEKSRLPQLANEGEEFSLLGKKYILRYCNSGEYKEPVLTENELIVYKSPRMTASDAQRLTLRYIVGVAEKHIKQAFDMYIPILELSPKRITIKHMTTRWGSCSSNGNISINYAVVCFEQECIDYVVIHELCHLKHMNHGNEFWQLVSTCCPNYKIIREKMRH